MSADGQYQGSVVVITGGSRGLGAAMALGFAREGATVAVVSRKKEACDEYAAYISQQTGSPAFGIECHVGRWNETSRLIDLVLDRCGAVDVLVNNAGMSPLYTSLRDVEEPLFDKTLAVNLKGPFRLGVLAADAMAARNGGAILNISSTASLQPRPEVIPYAVAKAGLNALTAGLAHAYGPKVRVNAILAGPFLTDVSKAWDMPAFKQRAASSIPLGRAGQPQEIVGAALYLCGPAAGYTSGAILKVDGGEVYTSA
jgi:NAD(P)-dependent dehydrogenase (short-subunit alcohol dehydrogenase family)